jgi:phosphate starvation-inducible membrane PsiE
MCRSLHLRNASTGFTDVQYEKVSVICISFLYFEVHVTLIIYFK